jgi:hypothetical protein
MSITVVKHFAVPFADMTRSLMASIVWRGFYPYAIRCFERVYEGVSIFAQVSRAVQTAELDAGASGCMSLPDAPRDCLTLLRSDQGHYPTVRTLALGRSAATNERQPCKRSRKCMCRDRRPGNSVGRRNMLC